MIREYLLQILLVAAGLLLLLRTIIALSRKHLTETISMFWSVLAIGMVVAGLVLIPFDWSQYITAGALVIVAIGFALVLGGMFYLSQLLSYTMRKTQELAIQISLLNQEHTKVNHYLSSLSGHSRNQIWRTNTVAGQAAAQPEKEDTSDEGCSACA